jgi:hypothetical protein
MSRSRSFALEKNVRLARTDSDKLSCPIPPCPTTQLSSTVPTQSWGWIPEKMFSVYIWTYKTTAKEERERISPFAEIFSYFTPHVKPKFQHLEV